MQRREWLLASVSGLLGSAVLGGCAGLDTLPSEAARSALAPTGRLRVGFLASPLYATRHPTSGELSGVAVDLGRELATRLGVPLEPVVHNGVAALMAGARPGGAGEWDVVLTGITVERAATLDFSAPYLQVEWGYLVGAGAAGAAVADAAAVDRVGVRVGVVERTFADGALPARLAQATLVRVASIAALQALLDDGRADVIVATKATLFAAARDRPGARVLDSSVLVEPVGMAVPKGRDAAAARYVSAFVEQAKAQGMVTAAIERARLQGVSVAPLG
jgi:polar amino acid transport system substrate-binding protein